MPWPSKQLAAGESFSETFTVTALDDAGNSSSETLTVGVNGRNDAPESADNILTLDEDSSHTFTAADFGFSDIDTGDNLESITITTLPTAGTLPLNDTVVTPDQVITAINISNLVFTPDANAQASGYSNLTFTVSDGNDSRTEQMLTVDVTAVNDAPSVEQPSTPLSRMINTQPTGNGATFVSLNDHATDMAGLDTGAISMWVKMDSGQGNATLFSMGDASSNNTQTFVIAGGTTGSYNDESLTFVSTDGNQILGMFVREGNDALLDNQWHHIAIVVDGVDNRIYIDGERKAVTFKNGSVTSSLFSGADVDMVNMGALIRNSNPNGNVFLDGEIADAALFSDTSGLTDSGIQTLMNQGPDAFDSSDLIFSTDFTGTGNTIIDTSGNNRHGTPFNGNLDDRGTLEMVSTAEQDVPLLLQEADLLRGFSDLKDDTLSVQNLTSDHGTAVNNNDDTWTFTPNSGFTGFAELAIEVTDETDSTTGNAIVDIGNTGAIHSTGSEMEILLGDVNDDFFIINHDDTTVTSGNGADIFDFNTAGESGDQANLIITDFNTGDGDVLRLDDLLLDNNDSLDQHLHFISEGNDTVMEISPEANGGVTKQVTFKDVDLFTLGNNQGLRACILILN